jgi:hypothetical protein
MNRRNVLKMGFGLVSAFSGAAKSALGGRGYASRRTTPLTVALFIFCLLGINGGAASQSAAQNAPGGHFLWEFDAGG